jgi:hypothetical protein
VGRRRVNREGEEGFNMVNIHCENSIMKPVEIVLRNGREGMREMKEG